MTHRAPAVGNETTGDGERQFKDAALPVSARRVTEALLEGASW